MNTEQQLEQIQERLSTYLTGTIHVETYREDVERLLSIVESQQESIDLLIRIPVVANDALNLTLGQIQESAAEQMRSRCVEKVREHLQCDGAHPNGYDCVSNLIDELESLTLQEQEAKQ